MWNHLLSLGTTTPNEHAKRKAAACMQRPIEHLGYTVTLQPATPTGP